MEFYVAWSSGSDLDANVEGPSGFLNKDFDQTADCGAAGTTLSETVADAGPPGVYTFTITQFSSCTGNVEFYDYEVYIDGNLVDSGSNGIVPDETVTFDIAVP